MKFFKKSFHRFCEGTVCHGFKELITSKTCFWRLFWSVILLTAIVATIYQVLKTLVQFINQRTDTFMVSADEDGIMYPPLRLCYWHWLNWVDFAKVKELKLDRDALLFAFLFYTRLFIKDSFNIDAAEHKLTKYMKDHNIASLFDFHKSIARPLPVVSNRNLQSYFDKREVIFRDPGFLYCYTMSNELIAQYLKDRQDTIVAPSAKKLIRFSVINENYDYNFNHVGDFATADEYSRYMVRWIRHKTLYAIDDKDVNVSLSTFSPPVLLFPNAFDEQNDVPIVPEVHEYSVNTKAQAYQWQDTREYNCAQGERVVSGNETCKFICEATVFKPNCSCVRMHYAIYMKKDTPDIVCRDEVVIQDSDGEHFNNSSSKHKTVYSQICSHDQTTTDKFLQCMNDCIKPCEVWSYTVSVMLTKMPDVVRRIGTKRLTNITIEYPQKNDIMIMVAVSTQSFEAFIGSVGGLLGIWTGASIVSFVQFIYLCCCADTENGECCAPSFMIRKQPPNNSTKHTPNFPVGPPLQRYPEQLKVKYILEIATADI